MTVMAKSLRHRMQRVSAALSRLDAAEKRAVLEVRAEGYDIHTIGQAKQIQAEYAEAMRLQALAVERINNITNRKAS